MKKTIIICLLVSLIPIGIIGGGLYWVVKKNERFEKYKKIKGEIVALNIKKTDNYYDREGVYFPKIRYYDDNGEGHTFELKVGSKNPSEQIGEKVDLLVNSENPKDAVIDSFISKWFGPTIVCIVGFVILILVSIVSVVAILNEWKQQKSDFKE